MSLSEKLRRIPVDKIQIGEFNVRKKKVKENLDELKKSIEREGLLQPIVVFPTDDKYELVIGQRRLLAVKELGWKEIPAIVLEPMSLAKAKIRSVIENIHRSELSFKDLCAAAEYLYDEYGGDPEAVAEALCISVDRAKNLLFKRLIPKPLREMVEIGKIKPKDAERATIAGWPDTEKIMKIAESLPKMTTDEKRRIVSLSKEKPEASAKELIEEAKKPPKEIELIILLPAKYKEPLEKASDDLGLDPEETGRIAIIDWLTTKGYV